MADYKFIGNYRANLIGRTIIFGSALRKDLERYGISRMFFVKGKEKGRNVIRAYPELPSGEEGIPVGVEEGRFRIPKKSSKKFIGYIEYAGLKPNEVAIIGIDATPNHLEIWNEYKIDEISESKTSRKGMEVVGNFHIEKKREELRKKLQVH